MFIGAEPILQFRKRASLETFMLSYKKFEPVVREEMLFKYISYLELWRPFCSVERNHSCNFAKGIMRNNFVK